MGRRRERIWIIYGGFDRHHSFTCFEFFKNNFSLFMRILYIRKYVHIYSIPPSMLSVTFQQPPPTSCLYVLFFDNPLSPVSAAHMYTGVGIHWRMETYQ